MKRICILQSVAMGLLATVLGCSPPTPPPVDEGAQAKAKVQAFDQLATELAKDPNGLEVRALIEQVRNLPLDVAKNRAEAEQIVEIYQKRMKGKFKGELAQEAQQEGAAVENALRAAK